MKKSFFICSLFTLLISFRGQAQGLQPGDCGIIFSYDASGNIIKREGICNNTGVVMNRQAKDSINNLKNNVVKEEIIKVNAIMPNPTTGTFTVSLSSPLNNATVMLLNTNGSILESKKLSGTTLSFNISNRSSGIYFVRIEYEGKALTFKVVKQ